MDTTINTNEEVVINTEYERLKNKRWLLTILGTIVMFSIGICYAWSILNRPMNAELGWKVSDLAVAFTIFSVVNSVFGVLSGYIIRWMKGRVFLNLIISGIFLFLSFYLSSLANRIALIYIGFGVFGGIGVTFAYNSCLTIASRWFKDHIGVVNGLFLMGYGLGSFLIGKVYSSLISNGSGWRDVFLYFGIYLLALLLISALLLRVPPKDYMTPPPKPKTRKQPIEPVECSPLELLKRKSFYYLFFMGLFLMLVSMSIISSASYMVTEVSPLTTEANIATIVGLISIFNALGRILIGFVNDLLGVRYNVVISSSFLVAAVFILGFAVMSKNLAFLIISFILFGIGAGMTATSGANVTLLFFGQKYYQVNIQIVMLVGGLGSLGAMLMGFLYDSMGTFVWPIFIIGAMGVLGLVSALLLKRP